MVLLAIAILKTQQIVVLLLLYFFNYWGQSHVHGLCWKYSEYLKNLEDITLLVMEKYIVYIFLSLTLRQENLYDLNFVVQVRNNPAALLALCWYWASDGVGSKVHIASFIFRC